MTAPSGSGGRRHADRMGLPIWLLASLTLCTALALAIANQTAARGRLTPGMAFAAGIGVAVLAMVGLPSVSVSRISRVLLFVSAVVLVRFGVLRGSVTTGGQVLLAWLVAAVGVLVLSDRVGTDAVAPLGGVAPGEATAPAGHTVRNAVAVAVVVVLAAVILAPLLLPYVGKSAQAGNGATLSRSSGGSSVMRASDELDMSTRPQLTDAVVFTVDTDRATFWRGQTFDRWDGRRWTRSDPRFFVLPNGSDTQPAPDDLGATGTDVVKQRFRVESDYSDVVYAAATAVHIDIDAPVRQRTDATLISAPLGEGATYTVTSRRMPLTQELLRSVDSSPVPAAVSAQYAQPPATTERVRTAAVQATAGAHTEYDKVLALEAWMGTRVSYSLDAPLAPKNVDIVDHFLFDAKQGWCEQIASSLVVMARANGIPARLVTGYVPDDHDPVTGQFTVRQRDTHAWAEVWFPKVGWVPFDPTANVPLAGADRSQPTIAAWFRDHLVLIGLVVAAVVVLVGPVRLVLRRMRARRANRPVGWTATTDRRLDALGRRVDRERRPDETARAYAAALGWRYGDDRLELVGRAVDDALYAEQQPEPATRAVADAVLDELMAAPVPEREPAVVGAGGPPGTNEVSSTS